MGVYIKDMEMPTEGYIDVRIKCNGTASFAIANNPYFKAVEAVPVPPHGRLVDAYKLMEEIRLFIKENMLSRDDARELLETIENAPTVIEAEDGET